MINKRRVMIILLIAIAVITPLVLGYYFNNLALSFLSCIVFALLLSAFSVYSYTRAHVVSPGAIKLYRLAVAFFCLLGLSFAGFFIFGATVFHQHHTQPIPPYTQAWNFQGERFYLTEVQFFIVTVLTILLIVSFSFTFLTFFLWNRTAHTKR